MSILDSISSSVAETVAGKTVAAVSKAVGDKIAKTWNQHHEYQKKLADLNTFCSYLIGLTESQAKIKSEENGLKFRVMRRNEKDYSFGGRIEKRNDRIMVEVDNGEITKAYLG